MTDLIATLTRKEESTQVVKIRKKVTTRVASRERRDCKSTAINCDPAAWAI